MGSGASTHLGEEGPPSSALLRQARSLHVGVGVRCLPAADAHRMQHAIAIKPAEVGHEPLSGYALSMPEERTWRLYQAWDSTSIANLAT